MARVGIAQLTQRAQALELVLQTTTPTVNVNIAGVVAACAIGIVIAAATGVTVTGVAASPATGVVTAAATSGSVAITGVAASPVLGTVTALGGGGNAVTGVAASAAVGTATASANSTVAVNGVAAAPAVGMAIAVAGSAAVQVTGVSAAPAVGTPTPVGGSAMVAVTGVAAAPALGSIVSVRGDARVSPTGASAVAAVGTVSAAGTGTGALDHSVMSAATLALAAGATSNALTITPKDAGGNTIPGQRYHWYSTDLSVATVDALTGAVTGVGAGVCGIFAVRWNPADYTAPPTPPVPSTGGQDWYVSNTGNDANSGHTSATAKKTLAAILAAAPGDNVYLDRAGTFAATSIGTTFAAEAGVYYDAYGVGPGPYIDGGIVLTGWTLDSPNVYKVNLSGTGGASEMLFTNGVPGSRQTSRAAVTGVGAFFFAGTILYCFSSAGNPDTLNSRMVFSADAAQAVTFNGANGKWVRITTRYGGRNQQNFGTGASNWLFYLALSRDSTSNSTRINNTSAANHDCTWYKCIWMTSSLGYTSIVPAPSEVEGLFSCAVEVDCADAAHAPSNLVFDSCQFLGGGRIGLGLAGTGVIGTVGNVLRRCTLTGYGGKAISGGTVQKGWLYEYCTVDRNGFLQYDRSGIHIDCAQTIRYCVGMRQGITGPSVGAALPHSVQLDFSSHDAVIHHSILFKSNCSGLSILNSDRCQAYNLTVPNNGLRGLELYGTDHTTAARNSIFYKNGNLGTPNSNYQAWALNTFDVADVIDHNCYTRRSGQTNLIRNGGVSYATLAAAQAAGWDASSIEADPTWADEAHDIYIPTNTALKNVGRVQAPFTDGYLGAAPDMGAIQFGTADYCVVTVAASNEPAGMTPLFDTQWNALPGPSSPSAEGWRVYQGASNGTLVTDAGALTTSGKALRILYPAAFGGGSAPYRYEYLGTYPSNTGTLYLRTRVFIDANWTNNGNAGTKFTFIRDDANAPLLNHYWGFDASSGATTMRLAVGTQFFGGSPPPSQLYRSASTVQVSRGVWHTIEILMTPNTPGTANGGLSVWLDGVAVAMDLTYNDVYVVGRTDVLWFPTGVTPAWKQIFGDPTYGGGTNAVPVDQVLEIGRYYASVK